MTHVEVPGAMPTPDHERRDDLGRLVAVSWHGDGDGQASGPPRWLVAVDGSACSLRAVTMVASLAAGDQGAGVDLVHVQPWLNKEAAEAELARRGWQVTAQARQALDAASISWRLHVLMGEGAPEIANLADALESRGIAIGSRGLTATESLLLGSVAYRLVHLARAPVLLVR
ncbi:MAG TPA: universal stress protein [Polaromonas sp.]|uniref:universal stress protein n=1 Tax=Polaromonas sp. TaxID=1869339 RepID=UPI002D2E3CA1|nr:universal stress protein [Polaromonas sp.]HYW56557.1 universal stress protein [Polaromonas sp.]